MTVEAGESVRFAPGKFQYGYTDGDGRAAVLGIGAPPESSEVETVRQCTRCDAVFRVTRPSLVHDPDASEEVDVPRPDCGGETERIGRPD